MKTLFALFLTTVAAFAQFGGESIRPWEPRDIRTKAGLVASYDPSNLSTMVFNPSYAPGNGVSALSNRVTVGTADLLQGTAANQPKISRTDNAGNICKYSEDITQTPWVATDATKTGAGELTFTAQNGKLIQNVLTASGLSYTFSFYARTNVPGNVNLRITHVDSASGNVTPITITGTLAPYVVTVLGRAGAGGNVSFGIQDANASGFGSILFTNMQVRVNTWDSTYIATLANPIFPGLGGRSVLYFDGSAYYMKTAAFILAQPEEIYLLCNQWTWSDSDTLYDGETSFSMRLYQSGGTPMLTMNAGSDGPTTTAVVLGAYHVVRSAFMGANSFRQVDSSAAGPVADVGAANAGAFALGTRGSATGAYANILVARTLICNKTNDVAEANYLKWGMMKQAGVY